VWLDGDTVADSGRVADVCCRGTSVVETLKRTCVILRSLVRADRFPVVQALYFVCCLCDALVAETGFILEVGLLVIL